MVLFVYASLWSLYAPLRRFTRVHRRVKTEKKSLFSFIFIRSLDVFIESVVNPSARFLSTNERNETKTTKKQTVISYFGYSIQSNVQLQHRQHDESLRSFPKRWIFYTTQISYTLKCESAEWMNDWTISTDEPHSLISLKFKSQEPTKQL